MRAGYEVWHRAVEQAGGIKVGAGRRPVRLHLLDDESEPLTAGRQAERLHRERGVSLFLGPFSSAITTSVATVTDRAGAVLVAPDASAASLFRRGLKGFFSILPTEDRLFHGLADVAALVQPRAQPVGIIIADEPSNAAAAAGFRERAAALDLGPVRLELTALGSTDIMPPLQRTAESTPRFVILATEAGQTARFTPSLREYVPYTAMRALVPMPEPREASGRRSILYDGILTVESWWPTIASSGPIFGSAAEYAERFRKMHGYQPDPRSASATAAGLALQLAMEAAGGAGPSAVRESLSVLDVMTFWGRLGWDTAGRNRASVPPVLQQQGDQLVTVYPRELAGGRLRYPLAGWPRG
jgi:branched-chain amino acid transport system substrate-binding protein